MMKEKSSLGNRDVKFNSLGINEHRRKIQEVVSEKKKNIQVRFQMSLERGERV